MISRAAFLRLGAAAVFALGMFNTTMLRAEEFPFGLEMTLDTPPQPGSKRLPTMEIGDSGEASLSLWCKVGKAQFSVAGNTVIFVPGQLTDQSCTPAKAQADDDLVAAMGEVGTWKRQGDAVSFVGTRTIKFRINTN